MNTLHGNRLGNDFVARQYDPALGRFLQADTIVPDPGNPQSLNRYSYTLGNPLRYTDPSGHRCEGFCDYNEMQPKTPVVEPFAPLQPEINLGLGEIVDFIVEPLITPGFPRVQIKAWDTSHRHLHLAYWGGDTELEWGQSLNGRWGSKGPWLIKAGTVRLETPKGDWIEYDSAGIAVSRAPIQLPGEPGIRNELRSISGFHVSPGVLQTALTLEYTAIASIPGVQTRGTTYLRVATNTYVRRYVAATVDVAVLATVVEFAATAIGDVGSWLPQRVPQFGH